MLAKSWKKILLAICIVACIYNVMSKIVNRHSLEDNLKTANDGEVVFDLSSKKTDSTPLKNSITENVISNTTTAEENTVEGTTVENEVVEELELEENETDNSSGTSFNSFNFDFLFKNT